MVEKNPSQKISVERSRVRIPVLTKNFPFGINDVLYNGGSKGRTMDRGAKG